MDWGQLVHVVDVFEQVTHGDWHPVHIYSNGSG